MTFSNFDTISKTGLFWTDSIQDVNYNINVKQDMDLVGKSGITLVIGCPLPPKIQENILRLRRTFDQILINNQVSAQVKWRKDLTSLHITVYGLIKPKDYERDVTWPISSNILQQIRNIVSTEFPFNLILQGLGILGSGAVAVRISDSNELDTIRNAIANMEGVSDRNRSEKTGLNQMIVGRFLPELTDNDRRLVKQAKDDLESFLVGEITVTSLELIHYKHEFLNRWYNQESFP